MTRTLSVCLALGLLLASNGAAAASSTTTTPIGTASTAGKSPTSENTSASAIRAQQLQIRTELSERKGRYKNLDSARRDELVHHQALVLSRLEGIERTTDLPEADQIAVFNSLEAIEAIVNSAEGERMICRRSKPVGSNRPKTVCRTVAQMRDEKEAADKGLERDQQCVGAPGFCTN